MIYRSGRAALELLERPDSEIAGAFLGDLWAIYPEVRDLVKQTVPSRLPRMLSYAASSRCCELDLAR